MSELSIRELENTAEAYERLLVPAIFEDCARRFVDAAEVEPGQDVLDVACGTGIVARTAAERVDSGGTVTGVDRNPGMLAVAKRLAPEVDWQEGAAEDLPYHDATFDTVLSQLGLMFFSDPEAALREMMRVVKTGGVLAVSVFDSLDNQPAYRTVTDIYDRRISKEAGEAGRGPFSMGDRGEFASLLANAGISTAAIASHDQLARFPSARDLVLGDVRGWFPFARIDADEHAIEAVVREAEKTLEPFRTPNGAIEAPTPIHIITATKA